MSTTTPKRSPLALAVLVMLYEEPMHVYRMQQLIKQRGEDEVINVSQPTSLYQTIARLERSGLLVASSVDRESNRPERIVYKLTEVGQTAMIDWTREILSTLIPEYPEFPAAISVLAVLTPKDTLIQLEKRMEALKSELKRLRGRLQETNFLPRLFRLEIECVQAHKEAELQWVQSVADDLRGKRLTWSKSWLKKTIKQMGNKARKENENKEI